MKTFLDENTEVLNNLLNSLFFNKWKDPERVHKDQSYKLELYVTSSCNQNCEYCYLRKYEEKLYPAAARRTDLILKNLRLLFDYLLENKCYYLCDMDIYSGEIQGEKLGFDVFDIILEYMDKGIKLFKIVIPTNGSFLLNEEKTAKVEDYMRKFESRGCKLQYSFSFDGLVVDNKCRPLNKNSDEQKRSQEFYEFMIQFCRAHNLGIHPMLSSQAAKYWVENLEWWNDVCKKYDQDPWRLTGILEVRNNDWTDETIRDYLKVLDRQVEFYAESVNYDITKMVNKFLTEHCDMNGGLNTGFIPRDAHIGCTQPRQLTVRLGDLAIAPCHRTAYTELLYGKFEVENDKITHISCNNIYTAMKCLTADVRTSIIGCDSCPNKRYCMYQCFGQNKEENGDMFINSPGVCKLLKAKSYHLLKLYDKMGLFAKYKEFIDRKVTNYSKFYYDQLIEFKNKMYAEKELEIYE